MHASFPLSLCIYIYLLVYIICIMYVLYIIHRKFTRQECTVAVRGRWIEATGNSTEREERLDDERVPRQGHTITAVRWAPRRSERKVARNVSGPGPG